MYFPKTQIKTEKSPMKYGTCWESSNARLQNFDFSALCGKTDR